MRTLATATLFVASFLLAVSTAAASARTPMGAVIENSKLTAAAGGKEALLGDAKANVLLFFRPDQAAFAGTLKSLAACAKELAGKPVRWVALVPARFTADEAKAAADAAGLQMPVLLDEGDAVYNLIAVSMHPTVAILDKEHRLVQFQPYSKLNFCESVMVRIKHVLGEVDDAGLARGLDPAAEQEKGNTAAAKRDLKLAEMLLAGGNLDKALEMAKKGVSNDPKSAAAQAVLGQVLAAKGECAEATRAFEAALKLDPNEARAKAGQSCAGKK